MSTESQAKIIANLTEGTYFVYNGDHETRLRKLFSKKNNANAIIASEVGTSRWLESDKIVFVPEHLRAYVLAKYNSVF